MITILTGTPGSGKTSWLISYLVEECKKGRKIYTDNVPELVLACSKAGRIDKWHEGSWLGIDTYNPLDPDDPNFDPDSCWDSNGNERPDAGALIVVDEAQRWFRPRNSSKAVPPHVAALEVHRHQGLDFLFITQRTRLLDSNVLGLASKHIHIKVTPFGRRIYEWAEIGNPDSREQRGLAAVSKYKPDPAVFKLYKSASLHTVLKHKLPNVVWMLGFAAIFAVFMIYKAGVGMYGMSHSDDFVSSVSASSQPISGGKQQHTELPAQRAARGAVASSPVSVFPDSESSFEPDSLAGCYATSKTCECQLVSGVDAGMSHDECFLELGITSFLPVSGAFGAGVLARNDVPTYWRDAQADFARLHPNKDFKGSRVWVAGSKLGYYK